MDKQRSQECSTENKSARFSMVEEPRATEMQLQLLPPDVLRDILSCLSLKEVVKMNLLSREWRRLRICHPDLVFTKYTFFAYNTIQNIDLASMGTEFVTKVDNVLQPLWSTSTTTTATLNKFVVKFKLYKNHKDHIDRWISFSIASRTKHIAIDFTEGANLGYLRDKDMYVVPLGDLSGQNGSCVKHLDLGNVCLKLPPSFCGITNLKTLTLKMVSINNVDLECMLLSCAYLESLSIEFCSFSSLSIQQDLCRLWDLRVRYCDLQMIDLHASNLSKIEFDDRLKHIVLTECFKLSEATFVSNMRSHNSALTELPAAIPHVHKLFVQLTIDQLLTYRGTPTKFVNLRHLNINIERFPYIRDTRWAMRFVNFLESTPLLEELELHLGHAMHGFLYPRFVIATQGPLHHHLKDVYMSGFCDVLGLAELALYILGNATALKRMVVDPASHFHPCIGIYSVSKGGITVERQNLIEEKRMFAQKYLDRVEFRRVLKIL